MSQGVRGELPHAELAGEKRSKNSIKYNTLQKGGRVVYSPIKKDTIKGSVAEKLTTIDTKRCMSFTDRTHSSHLKRIDVPKKVPSSHVSTFNNYGNPASGLKSNNDKLTQSMTFANMRNSSFTKSNENNILPKTGCRQKNVVSQENKRVDSAQSSTANARVQTITLPTIKDAKRLPSVNIVNRGKVSKKCVSDLNHSSRIYGKDATGSVRVMAGDSNNQKWMIEDVEKQNTKHIVSGKKPKAVPLVIPENGISTTVPKAIIKNQKEIIPSHVNSNTSGIVSSKSSVSSNGITNG
jgi:hypothetical protein